MKVVEEIIDGIKYKKIEYEESDLSTEEQRQVWKEICNTCEYFENGTCGKCGCIVENLMTMVDSTCPDNKW